MRGAIKSRLAISCGLFAAFYLIILTGCSGVSSGNSQSQNNSTATLAVSPSSLNFGNVAVGKNSALTGTLTANNADVTISSADWTGAGYSVTGITFPITVQAGKTANFTVTFAPQAAGPATGGVTFMSDASNPSLNQPFNGNGATQGQGGGGHSVALTWNPSTSTVVGYNIYRGTQPGGPYTRINSSLDTTEAYTDDTVASGTTYYYVATAVDNNNVESTFSSQAMAQVPSP